MKTFLLALLLLTAAWLPLAPALAGIPVLNGTCPGGLQIHADNGGPVFVNGHETRLKRFNDNYYEATDALSSATLSISKSPDGSTQVSYTGRGGVNGVCTVNSSNQPSTPPFTDDRSGGESGEREVTCESDDRKQVECGMDTAGDVRLVRQLSKAPCVQGESWGLHRHSVWVNDGCRAVFRNVSHRGGNYGSSSLTSGEADDLLGACNVRANARGTLVTRVPVNGDVTELIIDYPDGRFLCMLRNDGLIESFMPIRRSR